MQVWMILEQGKSHEQFPFDSSVVDRSPSTHLT